MEILFTRRRTAGAKGGNGRRLKKVLQMTFQLEEVQDRSVSLLLTDDREIHELNLQWRNKDKPTDVLAFAYDESLDAGIVIPGMMMPVGDIIISVETALKQSRSRKVTLDAELELLAVHGALHLLGYDHAEAEEAKLMRGRTRSIRNHIRKKLTD